ncbi:Thymidylate kinase [bacterium HR34]|nr:Thymidylate kinase [bacterium HR34]
MRKLEKIFPKNYFWISIEGTDAVGKTSLLNEIGTFLRNQRKINFAIIKEFSNSALGYLIQEIIKEKKFFSLENKIPRPLSETLILCADFIYQFEKLLFEYSKTKKTIDYF